MTEIKDSTFFLELFRDTSEALRERHKIGGLYYYLYSEEATLVDEKSYLFNSLHNEILLNEYKSLSSGINETIIPLKGIALLHDVYKDIGMRFLSDVDILILQTESQNVRQHLLNDSYREYEETKWYGNDYKSVYHKKILDLTITLETHEKLIFDHHDLKLDIVNNNLSRHDFFLHLCIHYAKQHNFQRLYWLVDIFLYSKKIKNWKELNNRAKVLKATKSLHSVLYLFNKFFHCKYPVNRSSVPIVVRYLKKDYLYKEQAFNIHYLALKLSLRANLLEAMKYIVGRFSKS